MHLDRGGIAARYRTLEIIGEALHPDLCVDSLAIFSRTWTDSRAIMNLQWKGSDQEIVFRNDPIRKHSVEELLDVPVRHNRGSIVRPDLGITGRDKLHASRCCGIVRKDKSRTHDHLVVVIAAGGV